MMPLSQTISETKVTQGSIMTWWLGGSGFVFKTPTGVQIYIDPYFTNCVASIFGVDRDFPAPISAEEARPDLLISTHWHEDHLDPEGLPIVAEHSPAAMFLCPPSCVSRLLGWLVPRDRVTSIKAGESHEFKDVRVTAVAARHVVGTPGWEVDDAIGVLLDFGGLRVYHSGDTEYDLRLRALAYNREAPIDVCMVAINGAGGNMNAHEAALLAWQLGAKTLIPMHHRLWKGFTGGEQATLDPRVFASTYQRLGGSGEVKLIDVGEGVELRP
jgi:L-ascorbate metabolism protein UlaG (beta-lactamase superfamily)